MYCFKKNQVYCIIVLTFTEFKWNFIAVALIQQFNSFESMRYVHEALNTNRITNYRIIVVGYSLTVKLILL